MSLLNEHLESRRFNSPEPNSQERRNKTLILICGASGCGKSTLETGLVAKDSVKKVVSVTTRQPRDGEEDGVDYHFITHQRFSALQLNNKLVQETHFAGNSYGTTIDEYTTDHPYATLVVVPSSAKTFIPVVKKLIPGIVVKTVFFDISRNRLIANMLERGDSPEAIEARLSQDDLKLQMQESGISPDVIITDETLNEKTQELVCRELGIPL